MQSLLKILHQLRQGAGARRNGLPHHLGLLGGDPLDHGGALAIALEASLQPGAVQQLGGRGAGEAGEQRRIREDIGEDRGDAAGLLSGQGLGMR